MPARQVFADAFYWVALLNPRDAAHRRAKSFSQGLASARIVTTDEVLTELLHTVSGAGPYWRNEAALSVRDLFTDPNVDVVPQDHAGFLDALDLYQRRPDKGYSLTDCRSMQLMYRRGITDVLTNDRHFTQEGFTILFP